MWHDAMKVVGPLGFGKKKTWPKVHFASFTICIVLTHDDDKIYPLLAKKIPYVFCAL
jgi:hypothetical protein